MSGFNSPSITAARERDQLGDTTRIIGDKARLMSVQDRAMNKGRLQGNIDTDIRRFMTRHFTEAKEKREGKVSKERRHRRVKTQSRSILNQPMNGCEVLRDGEWVAV